MGDGRVKGERGLRSRRYPGSLLASAVEGLLWSSPCVMDPECKCSFLSSHCGIVLPLLMESLVLSISFES